MSEHADEYDLVGRLWTEFVNDPNSSAGEAADRIQRLTTENERLRGSIRAIQRVTHVPADIAAICEAVLAGSSSQEATSSKSS